VDLDDATPAAPASSLNVKWQKDVLAPNNVSAYIGYGAGLNVAGGVLVCTITQYTDEMAQDACFAIGVSLATSTITPTYNDVANTMQWDVSANSITATEIMTIATDSLLGRDTPLAGNVEVIAIGAGMAMSGAQVLNNVLATTEIIPPVSRTIPTNYRVTTYGSYELTGTIALTIEGTGGMFIA
jgi:hypothetical protein